MWIKVQNQYVQHGTGQRLAVEHQVMLPQISPELRELMRRANALAIDTAKFSEQQKDLPEEWKIVGTRLVIEGVRVNV